MDTASSHSRGQESHLVQRGIGLICLVALSPVMLATGLAVMISLGRPVLFTQSRSGIGQRPFNLVKFRTMRDLRDAEGTLLPDELRTPRVGRFLRKTRLDELPGFFNVFCGDMRLIGPRPLLPQTIQEMGPDGQLRATIAPGMTGWSQVHGNTLLTNNEKLALDLWYIRNRTWRTDLFVILKTFAVVLIGEKISPMQHPEKIRRGRNMH